MKTLLLSIFAILLLIEEWLWDLLSALGHYLVELLGLAKFEAWLAQTTPNQALFAISIPVLIVTPINLFAFWLLAQGLILQGVILEIVAKLLGTLFIARFFTLTKTQLLTFNVLNKIYTAITSWLRWAHEKVQATVVYQWSKKFKAEVKAKVTAWLGKA